MLPSQLRTDVALSTSVIPVQPHADDVDGAILRTVSAACRSSDAARRGLPRPSRTLDRAPAAALPRGDHRSPVVPRRPGCPAARVADVARRSHRVGRADRASLHRRRSTRRRRSRAAIDHHGALPPPGTRRAACPARADRGEGTGQRRRAGGDRRAHHAAHHGRGQRRRDRPAHRHARRRLPGDRTGRAAARACTSWRHGSSRAGPSRASRRSCIGAWHRCTTSLDGSGGFRPASDERQEPVGLFVDGVTVAGARVRSAASPSVGGHATDRRASTNRRTAIDQQVAGEAGRKHVSEEPRPIGMTEQHVVVLGQEPRRSGCVRIGVHRVREIEEFGAVLTAPRTQAAAATVRRPRRGRSGETRRGRRPSSPGRTRRSSGARRRRSSTARPDGDGGRGRPPSHDAAVLHRARPVWPHTPLGVTCTTGRSDVAAYAIDAGRPTAMSRRAACRARCG